MNLKCLMRGHKYKYKEYSSYTVLPYTGLIVIFDSISKCSMCGEVCNDVWVEELPIDPDQQEVIRKEVAAAREMRSPYENWEDYGR